MRSVLVMMALSLEAGAALACGVCYSVKGDSFELPHPRAIEVAVATRAALDRGALTVPQLDSWNSRQKSLGLDPLRSWAEGRRFGSEGFSLHVVLVDMSESTAIVVRGGRAILHAQFEDAGDCTLVTSSVALRAILSGDLSLDLASRTKLAVIEGKREHARCLCPPDAAP